MDYKPPHPQPPQSPPPGYPNTNTPWDPNHQPAQPPLGTYNPGMAERQQAPMYQPAMQPMMQVPVIQPLPFMVGIPQGPVATTTFCPKTPNGNHVTKKEFGGMGVMVGVIGTVFCLPCFLVAIPMDTKISCQECYYVLKQGWGAL